MAVCACASLFVHVTVSPTLTVTVPGEYENPRDGHGLVGGERRYRREPEARAPGLPRRYHGRERSPSVIAASSVPVSISVWVTLRHHRAVGSPTGASGR